MYGKKNFQKPKNTKSEKSTIKKKQKCDDKQQLCFFQRK